MPNKSAGAGPRSFNAMLVTNLSDEARNGCSDERPLLNVWHDERTDRAVVPSVSDAHMAMVILTRPDLLRLEQVT